MYNNDYNVCPECGFMSANDCLHDDSCSRPQTVKVKEWKERAKVSNTPELPDNYPWRWIFTPRNRRLYCKTIIECEDSNYHRNNNV